MSDKVVRVYSSPQPIDGELIKARLEDEGIPAMLKGAGSAYPMGPVYVFVPEELEAQARMIIDAIERGEYAVDVMEDEPGR